MEKVDLLESMRFLNGRSHLDTEDQILDDLISKLFDPDVAEMDKRFEGQTIYKYYNFPNKSFQSNFFREPSIKFAVKSQLNDPFELTKRWNSFSTPVTQESFEEYIALFIENKIINTSYVDDILIKKLIETGKVKGLRQARKLIARLFDDEQKQLFIDQSRVFLSAALSGVFPEVNDAIKEKFEEISISTGIFSLTEVPDNRALWSVYAQSGSGFVIEFDAQNDFFQAKNNKDQALNRLRQVYYRDDRVSEFWKNPLYLFQVKNIEYSFEKEWRMMANVKDLDAISIPNGDTIYVDSAPVGLIKSIIFGYNFDNKLLKDSINSIRSFDANIFTKSAFINTESGNIEFLELV